MKAIVSQPHPIVQGVSSTFTNWALKFRVYKKSLSEMYEPDLFNNTKFFDLLEKKYVLENVYFGGLKESESYLLIVCYGRCLQMCFLCTAYLINDY
jgi:hypothetical protein